MSGAQYLDRECLNTWFILSFMHIRRKGEDTPPPPSDSFCSFPPKTPFKPRDNLERQSYEKAFTDGEGWKEEQQTEAKEASKEKTKEGKANY